MSFNPANFPFTMPKLPQAAPTNPCLEIAGDLKAAAKRYAQRTDGFAQGKADTCLDIAAKLERFGSFASEKQAEFARKLIEWSVPRWEKRDDRTPLAIVDPKPAAPALALPRLHDLMQRLAKLTIGSVQIVRKNQDTLCWIKHANAEKVVGRLTEQGTLTLWARPGVDMDDLKAALADIEKDPEAAAVFHGRASGRCAVCSRDLTDPESIARGIGPICAEKF